MLCPSYTRRQRGTVATIAEIVETDHDITTAYMHWARTVAAVRHESHRIGPRGGRRCGVLRGAEIFLSA